MLRKLLFGCVALSCLAGPGAVFAQAPCENVPGAELPDCSFEDVALSAWSVSGDSLAQSSEPPRSGSGSAEVDAFDTGVALFVATVRSACFPMTEGPGYGFGAWFRQVGGNAPDFCVARLFWYPNAACSAATNDSTGSFEVITTGDWTQSSGTASPLGTHARLELDCNSGGNFLVQIDDAFAGPDLVPVELQSFRVE